MRMHFAQPYFRRRRIGPRASGGITIPQLCAAYGLPQFKRVTSTTPIIAIGELGGGWNQADVTAAFKTMNLPAPNITDNSISGATNSPGDDADGEVALDIQVAAGVYSYMTGEAANVQMLWAPNSNAGFAGWVNLALQMKAAALSMSWGGPERSWGANAIAAQSALFAQLRAQGCAITAASGDSDSGDGASGLNCDFPASDPNVIGCGGLTTQLLANGGSNESVWNDGAGDGSGGGSSIFFPKPAYQPAMLGSGQPLTARGVPDVAANADPNTGYPIVLDGNVQIIGGTSGAAPFYAGYFAGCIAGGVVPQDFLTFIYNNTGDFVDITQGNNGGYQATPGYDLCSGIGRLKGAALFNSLLNGGAEPPPPSGPPTSKTYSVSFLPAAPTPLQRIGIGRYQLPAVAITGTATILG